MSSIPRKIVGGLLASLLALFCAVVVATPAWALDHNESVPNATQLAQTLFGSDASKVQIEGNTITVPANVNVGANAGSGAGTLTLTLPEQYTLVVNGIVSVSNPVVFVGQNLTISGTGTIQANTSDTPFANDEGTDFMLAVGNYESNGGGNLTLAGSVKVSGNAARAIKVQAGNLAVGADTTVSTANGKQGLAAIQVGSGGNKTTVPATCTIDGTVSNTAGDGVCVTGIGQVTINEGAKVSGGGSSPAGNGVSVVTNAAKSTPSLTVNGGEIKSSDGAGIQAGVYSSEGSGTIVAPGGSGAGTNTDSSAAITVTGGTIEGKTYGIQDVFPTGNVSVSGSPVITGETEAFSSSSTSTTVSGGKFSTPVNPSQLDPSLKVMGVIPGRGGSSSYQYFATDTEANAAGATATVSVNTTATIDILAYGVVPGDFDSTDSGTPTTNPVLDELKSLGLAANGTLGQAASSNIKENMLYVVWYGSSTASVTATIGNTTNTAAVSGQPSPDFVLANANGENGFNFAYMTLDNTAGQTAGTYTISAIVGTAQVKQTIDVAGVQVIQPAVNPSATETDISDVNGTSTMVFMEADSAAKSVDLPEINPSPLKSDQTQPMALGWYQLTPVTAPAAGQAPANNYNAALYSGTTWTPSTAAMTYLIAGYAAAPTTGVTATLAIDPTNVTATANAAQATLTLTIGSKALSGTPTLPNLSQKLKIANEPSLKLNADAVANGVASAVASAFGTGGKGASFYSASNLGAAISNNPPTAVLAAAPEGESNPAISGENVVATLDLSCDKVELTGASAVENPLTMVVDLSSVGLTGVKGGVAAGATTSAPKLTQPAATFNVFQGVKVTAYGNGTFTQTVNADGTVTLTAVPADGAKFIGWQDKLGNNISTSNPWVLSKAAVQSLPSTGLIAFFEGGSEPAPGPVPPTPEGQLAVYRLYDEATGEHLLTSSTNEVAQLTKGSWILDGYDKNPQGIAFYELPNTESGVPVYRVYDYGTGTHMYTTSLHEVTVLVNRDGWHWDNNEQPIFTTPATSNYPVYRLYNGSLPLNVSHLWTASWNEFNTLRNLTGAQKWTPEPNESGVAWWATALPTGPNV